MEREVVADCCLKEESIGNSVSSISPFTGQCTVVQFHNAGRLSSLMPLYMLDDDAVSPQTAAGF
jgi:hypothetical protein